VAGIGTMIGSGLRASSFDFAGNALPAVLGGAKAIDKINLIKWPIWIPETDEKQVLDVLRSGVWSRANLVTAFEKEWAATLGAKRCLTVVNGTNALIVTLNQMNIQGGDEVLVTPYTFIATIQAILANGAMPVFVDVDPATFQIDPSKIEAKITSKTKAIMPVHILGLPADMDRIMAIAKNTSSSLSKMLVRRRLPKSIIRKWVPLVMRVVLVFRIQKIWRLVKVVRSSATMRRLSIDVILFIIWECLLAQQLVRSVRVV